LRASRFNSRPFSMRSGLQAALQTFTGPVLLAWGEHDATAVPREIAPQLAAACRDATWRIIDGAGHWAQYERADDVSSRFANWFGTA
jgi:pimeloyl-ACP methyl ester carboxylesterase